MFSWVLSSEEGGGGGGGQNRVTPVESVLAEAAWRRRWSCHTCSSDSFASLNPQLPSAPHLHFNLAWKNTPDAKKEKKKSWWSWQMPGGHLSSLSQRPYPPVPPPWRCHDSCREAGCSGGHFSTKLCQTCLNLFTHVFCVYDAEEEGVHLRDGRSGGTALETTALLVCVPEGGALKSLWPTGGQHWKKPHLSPSTGGYHQFSISLSVLFIINVRIWPLFYIRLLLMMHLLPYVASGNI